MIKDETLRILEFDKILTVIDGFAYSDATRLEIHALRPLRDRVEIMQRFGRIEEPWTPLPGNLFTAPTSLCCRNWRAI